jgi:hypothetical protein
VANPEGLSVSRSTTVLLLALLVACEAQPRYVDLLSQAYCVELEHLLSVAAEAAATSTVAEEGLYETGMTAINTLRSDVWFCVDIRDGLPNADPRWGTARDMILDELAGERDGERSLSTARRVEIYEYLRDLVADANQRPLLTRARSILEDP